MGVRILEGRKINDGPNAGTGAVLYCSTSGIALAPMFEDGAEAQRFLDWFDGDPRTDEDKTYWKWQDWLKLGKPLRQVDWIR